MIKKLFVVFIIGLLINLILGQFSPSYSQNVSKLKYIETGNISLNKINNTKVLFDSTFKQELLVLQPLSSNDIIPQFVLGFGVGSLATLGAAISIAGITGISFDPGGGGHTTDFGAMAFFLLLASVQVFATAGLVWAAGTNNKVGSKFGYTLLGSLAGLGLEIGGLILAVSLGNSSGKDSGKETIAWITAITSITLPTIGAMIGLNSNRFPKRVYGKPKSVVNLNGSSITFSEPSIYLELDKTIYHKPITFAKIVSLNF